MLARLFSPSALAATVTVDWAKLAESADHVATVLAVVVGGGWVYFKFIRGRTFARRAEIGVAAELLEVRDHPLTRARVTLKNTGLSKLELRQGFKMVNLFATPQSPWVPNTTFDWIWLMRVDVFSAHQWVESGETVTDEALLPLDLQTGNWLAFQVQAEIWAADRPWRPHGPRWITNTIIPAQLPLDTDKTEGGLGDGAKTASVIEAGVKKLELPGIVLSIKWRRNE